MCFVFFFSKRGSEPDVRSVQAAPTLTGCRSAAATTQAGNAFGTFAAGRVGQRCHLYRTWGQRSAFHAPLYKVTEAIGPPALCSGPAPDRRAGTNGRHDEGRDGVQAGI